MVIVGLVVINGLTLKHSSLIVLMFEYMICPMYHMHVDSSVPFLDFKDVTIIKDGITILDSLSITITKDANVVILGPNGSGKSTFIKLIMREYYPAITETPSVFRIWGRETWNAFELRSHFGIVSSELQHLFTNRKISGKELLLSGFFSSIGIFFHQVTQEMEKRALEVASFLEITHLLDRPLSHMSSGEGRRLLIGRALIHRPQVLILDEPTTSLDLHAQHILRHFMRKIAQSGLQIILVTHQIHDIIPEINQVLMLKNGRFFQHGNKEEILTDENVGNLFSVPVHIRQDGEYYYATGY
jgi:iron complex transport system ATP-binding protein